MGFNVHEMHIDTILILLSNRVLWKYRATLSLKRRLVQKTITSVVSYTTVMSNFISSASDRKRKKNKIKQLYNTTQRNETKSVDRLSYMSLKPYVK